MSSHWDEVVHRYRESAAEAYLAEAEAVIGDGNSRFGGWLVLTDIAFYIGREGLAGLGRTKDIIRAPRAGAKVATRSGTQPGADYDLVIVTESVSVAAHLRNGRPLVEALAIRESHDTPLPPPSKAEEAPATEADDPGGVAALRVPLSQFAPWGPDTEGVINADFDGSNHAGLAWVVSRYLLWASTTIPGVVVMPATSLIEFGWRTTPEGREFRFVLDHLDEDRYPYPHGPNWFPTSPWHMTVLFRRGPFFEDLENFNQYLPRPWAQGRRYMQGAREIASRAGGSVADWTTCPLCLGSVVAREFAKTTPTGVKSVDSLQQHPWWGPRLGAAWCSACRRAFSDPGLRPVLEASPGERSSPLGVVPIPTLMGELEMRIHNLPQAWLVTAAGDANHRAEIDLDGDLLCAAARTVWKYPKWRPPDSARD